MNRQENPTKNIVILVIFLIMIIILTQVVSPGVIKSLNRGETMYEEENTLLNAGKDYYSDNQTDLPTQTGEYSSVTAETLIKNDYMDPITDSNGELCNFAISEVKAQKIGDNKCSYSPILYCDNYSTLQTTNNYSKNSASFSNLVEWLDTFVRIMLTVIMAMLVIIGPPYGAKKYLSLIIVATSFVALAFDLYVFGISVISEWIVIIANMAMYMWMNSNE